MFLSSDVMIIKEEELPVTKATVTVEGEGEGEGVYTFACKQDALEFIAELGYSPA